MKTNGNVILALLSMTIARERIGFNRLNLQERKWKK